MTTGCLLIVNADDYGLTERVSRAILTAYRGGIVRSTSVLANAPAFERTVSWLDDHPDLGVGIHLALVGEDPPILSAREIPTLVDRRGRLPLSWRRFAARALVSAPDPDDIRRELLAQIERVRQKIQRITHVDSHQHLHLWPVVRPVVIALAQALQIRAIRVPRSNGRRLAGIAVNRLTRGLETAARRAGLRFTASSAGFDDSGHLDEAKLLRSLTRLVSIGASSAELLIHPGEAGDPDLSRYRWNYQWSTELAAACAPSAQRFVAEHGFRLGSYAEL